MSSFKDPSFQDRAAAADRARQKALDKLASRPAPDAAELAARREAWEADQQRLFAERAAKKEETARLKAEKAAGKAADAEAARVAAELKAARLKPASPEEMKAARDARYAARKARK
ncbi:DUF6481 family protein [Sphingomonas kaistensis]|uniref:DUF6481 family protein n=1 Tax=Sphingomonas kaistensis TaxID=298708 RepID=A0ABZ2G3G6_9SPHN